MTINGGQPHRVDYAGQDYRVVVDENRPGEPKRILRIGWMNVPASDAFITALNMHPCWSNARSERVVDKVAEAAAPEHQAVRH